jgi:hypothetical protein
MKEATTHPGLSFGFGVPNVQFLYLKVAGRRSMSWAWGRARAWELPLTLQLERTPVLRCYSAWRASEGVFREMATHPAPDFPDDLAKPRNHSSSFRLTSGYASPMRP